LHLFHFLLATWCHLNNNNNYFTLKRNFCTFLNTTMELLFD
jgi:hypothetical protein